MKQGDWLVTDNGLGSPTLVYLVVDDGKLLGQGWFTAWFYNANFGLDCADMATFHIKYYPNSRVLSEKEIESLPSNVRKIEKEYPRRIKEAAE